MIDVIDAFRALERREQNSISLKDMLSLYLVNVENENNRINESENTKTLHIAYALRGLQSEIRDVIGITAFNSKVDELVTVFENIVLHVK